MYNLDNLVNECNTDKHHRSRLAARINKEGYGIVKYDNSKHKCELELTADSYYYWIRKLNSNRTVSPTSSGYIYCVLLQSFQIHKNEIMSIMKVGRCADFQIRLKYYNGPLAVKIVIGNRLVNNMRKFERELITTMKREYELLGSREEYFLVPAHSVKNLTSLFNSVDVDNSLRC